MKRALSVMAVAALAATVLYSPAQAKGDVPEEFGSEWDEPHAALEPMSLPDTDSCEVVLLDHTFVDDEPYAGEYTPSGDCGDDWSAAVLSLEGTVTGEQAPRLGLLRLGGSPVFQTSTPQPSPEGVEWSTEHDLTEYLALLREDQPVEFSLDGDVAGALDLQLTVTVYDSDEVHSPAESADQVRGLYDVAESGAELSGQLRTPRNSERLLADVYAAAAPGGCEEHWYRTAPDDAGYDCESAAGPHREVEVRIDGEIAGIATPYPHVYATGWSNPYLWHVLAAPRAFDMRPITYDLSPYLGMLNDGQAHDVSVRVAGAEENAAEWSTPTTFRVWQDHDRQVVEGAVMVSDTTADTADAAVVPDGQHQAVESQSSRRHTATGWLETSAGHKMFTVERTVAADTQHRWMRDEPGADESFSGQWSDVETRTTLAEGVAEVRRSELTYDMQASMSAADERTYSHVELSDAAEVDVSSESGRSARFTQHSEYVGDAEWSADAVEHAAVGESEQRHQSTSARPHGAEVDCYDRLLAAENGVVTRDRQRCDPPR